MSADRDPHPALFRLLVRAFRALGSSSRPAWVSVCFAARAVDLLGYRPQTDRCVVCGRPAPLPRAVLDREAGVLACERCRPAAALPLSGAALAAFKRLRALRWEESLPLSLAPVLEGEVILVIEGAIARLAGQMPRSTRFLAQVRRSLSRVAEPAPAGRRP